jgi:FK506-binding protein 2
MYRLLCSLTLLASAAVGALGSDLKIDVTLPVECDRKTQNGDSIEVHYRGTLASNGNKFDASYDRGTPFGFQIGAGRVIKGWDNGLLDMCIGEKRQAICPPLHPTPRRGLTFACRTLTVPPELGYGNQGMGPIPAGSTLSKLPAPNHRPERAIATAI